MLNKTKRLHETLVNVFYFKSSIYKFLVDCTISLSCVFVCSSNNGNIDGGVDCDFFLLMTFHNGCKLVCDVNVICFCLDTVAYCL